MNTIVHTMTLMLIYRILSIKQSQRMVFWIIVLFVSMLISIFHLHIFIETINKHPRGRALKRLSDVCLLALLEAGYFPFLTTLYTFKYICLYFESCVP